MISLETFCFHSVEEFIPKALLGSIQADCLANVHSGSALSLHTLNNRNSPEAEAIYSPAGRATVRCSEALRAEFHKNFRKHLDAINCVFPKVTTSGEWYLVLYEEGQYISPHVDLPDQLSDGSIKYGALVCPILNSMMGGQFYIETSRDSLQWLNGGPDWEDEPTVSHPSFRGRNSTEWICAPAEGTAILFGCRTIHGTKPVEAGFILKAMTFMYGDSP